MIQHLEQAGLGYHIQAEETHDKLGRIPMRRLVYRVQPLPRSMLPLVWDFGQLSTQVEELYIRQMVLRHVGFNVIFSSETASTPLCLLILVMYVFQYFNK